MPVLATNKISKSSFKEVESWEAGISLTGNEVKSVKAGQINLKGSYVSIRNNEAYLIGAHITPFQKQPTKDDPDRDRKLLLHKKELNAMVGHGASKGLTILPTKVYTKGGLIKVDVALMRGQKEFEKRETIKKRDLDRSIQRALRQK